jgi:hypothetical protein
VSVRQELGTTRQPSSDRYKWVALSNTTLGTFMAAAVDALASVLRGSND